MTSPPDIDRLIAEVAARHGILLKRDDAAFALVTLNQLVLEQVMTELGEKLHHEFAEIEAAFTRQQSRTGSIIGREIKRAITELHETSGRAAPVPPSRGFPNWRWIALAATVVFGAGLLAGMLVK
jgi:hypothetical protein